MSLEIEGFDDLVNEEEIRGYVEKVLEKEYDSKAPVYVSLLFTGNDEIQVINREYRDKDQPTDVISFAYHETEDFDIGPYDTLGDIVISLERVVEQAKEYNHSPKRLKIPLFHMQPRNRCWDWNVSEMINPKIVDHISEINLPYTEHSRRYLLSKAIDEKTIFVTLSPIR